MYLLVLWVFPIELSKTCPFAILESFKYNIDIYTYIMYNVVSLEITRIEHKH